MTPIHAMIDAVVRCTICGERPGCKCWVFIRCTACGAKRWMAREPDFFDFDEIEIVCPECTKPPEP